MLMFISELVSVNTCWNSGTAAGDLNVKHLIHFRLPEKQKHLRVAVKG